MIEEIETHLHVGDKIDVKSTQTATVGEYMGIVLNALGEPMIALKVGESPTPVVYTFGEVRTIEHVDVVAGRDGVRVVEHAVA